MKARTVCFILFSHGAHARRWIGGQLQMLFHICVGLSVGQEAAQFKLKPAHRLQHAMPGLLVAKTQRLHSDQPVI